MTGHASAGDPRRVVVSVDDHYLGDVGSVADALRGCGMHIDEVLDGLGMITGSIPDEQHTTMVAQVVGVASVDHQLTYRIPPPDADVQ